MFSGMCSTYVFVMKELQLGVTVWWGPGEVSYLPVSNFAAPRMKIGFFEYSDSVVIPHFVSRGLTGAHGVSQCVSFPHFCSKNTPLSSHAFVQKKYLGL